MSSENETDTVIRCKMEALDQSDTQRQEVQRLLETCHLVAESESYTSKEDNCRIHLEPARDITEALCASGRILTREVHLKYDDGSTSSIWPLHDCVLEYHPTIMKRYSQARKDGSATFLSGYMVRYASLGIKTRLYESLMRKVVEHVPGASGADKASENNDYTWFRVNVSEELPAETVPENDGTEGEAIVSLGEFMHNAKASVLGEGACTMRLKSFSYDPKPQEPQWRLAMSLKFFTIVNFTERKSLWAAELE
jgi:hypothetical protein